MKILIITPRYFPEQFSITRIAETLCFFGNEVTVLTGIPHYGYSAPLEGYNSETQQIVNGVRIIRVKEKPRLDAKNISLVKNYLSIFMQYPKALSRLKESFDIVLSHNLSPIFSMRGIKRFCEKRHIPHMHYGLDLWPESLVATSYFRKTSFLFKIMKSYCRKLYSSCDLIAFASPSTESYFHSFLNLPSIPWKQIYQPSLISAPDMNDIINHVFKENGKLIVTYCGSIAKFHRLDLLISALSLCANKEHVEIHIIGSGSELLNIQKQAKDYGLSQIIFYGRVPAERTRYFLLNSDILFIPLINNSKTSLMIPQKAIEYLMYGKPILGMISGDGREILERASSINFFAEETPQSIAQKIDEYVIKSNDDLKNGGMQNRFFFDNEPRFQLETICIELEYEMKKLISIRTPKNSK